MPSAKRATRGAHGNAQGAALAGQSVRMVASLVTATLPPASCMCTWQPVEARRHGELFRGWQLKFRHAACPAKLRGEHR